MTFEAHRKAISNYLRSLCQFWSHSGLTLQPRLLPLPRHLLYLLLRVTMFLLEMAGGDGASPTKQCSVFSRDSSLVNVNTGKAIESSSPHPPTLQIGKLRLREEKGLTQDHTALRQETRAWPSCLLIPYTLNTQHQLWLPAALCVACLIVWLHKN